jgi:hypothetical protein
MTSEKVPGLADGATGEDPRPSRRAAIVTQIERLVTAIRTGDEAMVERTVLVLSQRSRWLAPLALLVGAFAMLFQGVKLLFTNWRLTLVQILPAMWIWAAMLDLKAHALHGKEFHILRGGARMMQRRLSNRSRSIQCNSPGSLSLGLPNDNASRWPTGSPQVLARSLRPSLRAGVPIGPEKRQPDVRAL